jgi:hypothetical protein
MARSDAHRQQLTFGKQERHTSTGRSQMFFPQNRASTTTISPAANVSSLDFDVYGVVNPAASAAGGAASSFMRSFGVDQAPDRLAADAATEQNQHASQTPRSNLTLSEAPHREHGGVVLRPYRGTSSR